MIIIKEYIKFQFLSNIKFTSKCENIKFLLKIRLYLIFKNKKGRSNEVN